MHDPLSVSDLVQDELRQRIESGYDVSGLEAEVAATDADDRDRLEALYQELIKTERRSDWAYQEPDSIGDILDAMPASPLDMRAELVEARALRQAQGAAVGDVADRILGGWLGRIAGCNLGKPIENGDFWTPERIRSYLELADAYPLRDYIPALDPMPEGFQLNASWPETTRGRVHGSARDDDIDYSILSLWLLEQYGFELSPSLVANAWLALLPYLRVFTAERAVLVSLLHNVPVATVGETRNPYREWIGALIRADVCWLGLSRAACCRCAAGVWGCVTLPPEQRDLCRHVGGRPASHPPVSRLPSRRQSSSRWTTCRLAPGWPRH